MSRRKHGNIKAANAEALRRLKASQALLVDVAPAGDVIPKLGANDFLHAGPPLLNGWNEACGALRGAVLGSLIHRGAARGPEDAEQMASSGQIRLVSASEHDVLATYGGVIARETRVFVVENREGGTRAFSAINEGRGKALRYGSHDPDTLNRYAWMEGEFADLLGCAVRHRGGVDLFEILSQALQMGDDGHSRQKAAGALFANAVAPSLCEVCGEKSAGVRALTFLATNEIFFLPLTMAAAKAAMLWAEGIDGSTIVTAMAANGSRWGIRISGCGKRWFTAPVPVVTGHYFEGFDVSDASPVIGDSEIAETFGFGAFAMSGAPALARFMGGSVDAMQRLSLPMFDITSAEHERFRIPILDYRGAPLGIDAEKVVSKNIEPIFNTGIAHKDPGIGQIGAGFGRVPMHCFKQALAQL
ncbi:MAG: DUF1116 domain-containing protein [Pseudomonadota bacterium]|nr:DUF1116 domain-containing protein [Pseudomonadota bacterium]